MKRLVSVFFLASALLWRAAAQDDGPTTTWPYLFSEFRQGEVFFHQGGRKACLANVLLSGGRLHFIDGPLVKEERLLDVDSCRIGGRLFVNVSGELLEALAASEKAMVLQETAIDFSALNETGGAYGSSSATLGTMALSSLEGIGASKSTKNLNHIELRRNRENGRPLVLTQKEYIYVRGRKIEAAKGAVLDLPGTDSGETKAFIKQNKVRFNRTGSLLALGAYLYDKLK